jgi:hypothetical protein
MAIKPFSRLVKVLTGVYSGGEVELSRLERFAHFCALVIRSFVRNRCLVRASALSYTTLLALIPLLAVAISVTSSLLKNEGEEKIYQAIDKLVSNVMPPATLNTNDQAVSLNLSPGISMALTPANAVAETNVVAAGAGDSGGDTRATAQKEAAQYIHKSSRTSAAAHSAWSACCCWSMWPSRCSRTSKTLSTTSGASPAAGAGWSASNTTGLPSDWCQRC